ncbi:S8 family serine peptidase [Jiangella mangrovi]|uniref:Subtilisin family serine protease n=1 Tax=Jiangella mangrovi TaxID=1524084 RepID=A0A7W9LMV1_9ACTN|nr:S8 family serine peptidase [Jiangella mangrovi]MBB5789625.1 subtilisin family serine protease [Jiangella mangrovi]
MRRSWRAATAAVVLTGLVAQVIPAATAEPAGPAESPPLAVPAGGVTVTLITGDRVHVTTAADGRAAATVDPAARADGTVPGFHEQEIDGHLYVVPADVAPLVPDLLDRALFDVTALIGQGYDDASSDVLPVIVEATASAAAAARGIAGPQLPAVTPTDSLESIGAVAADVDKDAAAALADALTGARPMDSPAARTAAAAAGPLAGVEKIWLDQTMSTVDEDSAPQVGAPEAWAAGFTGDGVTVAVLDTGIDSTHPDLAGKVVAEANFSVSDSTTDRYGHGTHVASIVAGTGAASDGQRRGIAYEADLMNVKVLDDGGSGPMSEVIAGMEWAVDNGADVVNLSLGVRGGYTDGTDPASQAVNELSAESGALFVIAAGNDGPGDGTVTTPGAATSALTVGAVDKQNGLAGFSSRGPRAGDFALKPDVTAPGVGIIAARAAGAVIGTPVGDDYLALDGTSMATPHVAGAAALLAQQRPEWTGPDLKAALASTTSPNEALTVYEQGTGRIDLARATSQQVVATTGPLDAGYFPYPQDDAQPVTRTVTYHNTGSAPVVLSLAASVTDEDGAAPAPGMVTLGAPTVTVPAGGTADAAVTVDPAAGDYGLYGGRLVATGPGGVSVRTALGFHKESERYDLTVRGIARDGRPAGGISLVDVVNVDDTSVFAATSVGFVDGAATLRVPPGRYAAMGYVFTYDEPHVFTTETAAVFAPEFVVAGDTSVTLDARDTVPIEVSAPDPVEATNTMLAWWRSDPWGKSYAHSFSVGAQDSFASPTEPVTVGDFEYYTQYSLVAPLIQVRTLTPVERPIEATYVLNSALLDGEFELPIVYAGLGRPADFEGVDVDGGIALIQRGEITFLEKMRNAEAAGAKLVMIFNNVSGALTIGGDPSTVPTMAITRSEGEALLALLDQGPVTAAVSAIKVSPYLYDLVLVEEDVVPPSLDYVVDASNTTRVDVDYHSHVPGQGIGELRHKWRPWDAFSFGFLRRTTAPQSRVEYVSGGDTSWAQYAYGASTDADPFGFPMLSAPRTYAGDGERVSDAWFRQVLAPGVLPVDFGASSAAAYRSGDEVSLRLLEWTDGAGHYGGLVPSVDTPAFRLIADGAEVASGGQAVGTFPVPADSSSLRIELDVARSAPWWLASTATSTAWTVPSSTVDAPTTLPLLTVGYGVNVSLLNVAAKPGAQFVDLTVGHQPGAVGVAPVAGASVSVSFDDGVSWQPARVVPRGGGEFRAVISRVPADATHLSLRVSAWDGDGGRIEQVVLRAYTLD